MQQTITINLSYQEATDFFTGIIERAIDRRLKPIDQDELMTVEQATDYLKCSTVFLWKMRKEGKIKSVSAGKKILIPRSSIDAYLRLRKGR